MTWSQLVAVEVLLQASWSWSEIGLVEDERQRYSRKRHHAGDLTAEPRAAASLRNLYLGIVPCLLLALLKVQIHYCRTQGNDNTIYVATRDYHPLYNEEQMI